MKTQQTLILFVCAVFACAPAQALITIPTVQVGNPGNPADMRYTDGDHPNGVGRVDHQFHMGKTEVTNAQYVAFLNAVASIDTYGLFNTDMGNRTWGGVVRDGTSGNFTYSVKPPASGGTYSFDDKPVVFVSWGDVARFANWLHNGQPTGPQNASTTEDGAYTLNGATTITSLAAVTRNPGARWWIPSEDEWYKSAYHKNDGATNNYWDYPTGSDSEPNNNLPTSDTGNSANFFDGGSTTGDSSFPMTDVGAYLQSSSAYGTFDQGGNVSEWNETMFPGTFASVRAGVRGGDWGDHVSGMHPSIYWIDVVPTDEISLIGFRVAGIPEPGSITLSLGGALAILSLRKCRR